MTYSKTDFGQYNDIIGLSGGGIFLIDNEQKCAQLVGIENKMENTNAEHDRLSSVSIKAAFEIIKQNDLKPIKPEYLSSFRYVQNDIFKLGDVYDIQNIQDAITLLKQFDNSTNADSSISPYSILEEFKANLKVLDRDVTELENKALWAAFLEFLIVLEMIYREKPNNGPQSWTKDYVASLFKKYRIIYINSEKSWKQFIQNIFATNTDNLDPNGKIIFISHGDKPTKPNSISEINQNLIPHIADALANRTEAITNATSNLSNKIPIIHLPKLHDNCIADNELEISKLNIIQHKDKLLKLVMSNYHKYLHCES